MFIEPHSGRFEKKSKTGWIEVICGSMFSGKTEELIRRLNRALIAKQRVEIFKPKVDNRYHAEDVVSHDSRAIRSTPVSFPSDILLMAGECEVVGIDEAQFFDNSLKEIVVDLANNGKRVIVAGLDMDFEGNPFGPMPAIMSVSEYVTKVHAICARCGALASYSYRLLPSKEQVMLGEQGEYEARCRQCFIEGMKGRT